jgi:hypothetical protein
MATDYERNTTPFQGWAFFRLILRWKPGGFQAYPALDKSPVSIGVIKILKLGDMKTKELRNGADNVR